MFWEIILAIIGLVVFYGVISVVLKKTPKRYYRKARTHHLKGEKNYAAGFHEVADAYYDKAEEFRQKARDLE